MGSISYILLKFLFLCYFGKVYCGVPVFIWESSAITEKEDVVPALSQLDVDEFTNHLVKKIHIHKPLIVVFLEETLSVEDFSWKDNRYKGSFPQLKNITSMSAKLEFIPSVDDPLTSLRELIVSHDYVWKKYDGVKLPVESGIILVVKMKDPLNYEDRPQMLRRHDGNIAEIYSQLLAKHSRIIAIFTGKQSSWVEFESNRVKRDASGWEKALHVGDISLYFNNDPVIYDGLDNITLSGEPNFGYDHRTTFTRMILRYSDNESHNFPGKVILRLKFPKSEGRWSLSEIEYQDNKGKSFQLLPAKENKVNPIGAEIGSPFRSNLPLTFQYFDPSGERNISLVIDGIQVEAYGTSPLKLMVPSLIGKASTGNNGPPFFTEAIWSGLIVTFILGIILAWGITMLLDIRTMDRFDDPKGKTISVSAVE